MTTSTANEQKHINQNEIERTSTVAAISAASVAAPDSSSASASVSVSVFCQRSGRKEAHRISRQTQQVKEGQTTTLSDRDSTNIRSALLVLFVVALIFPLSVRSVFLSVGISFCASLPIFASALSLVFLPHSRYWSPHNCCYFSLPPTSNAFFCHPLGRIFK